MTRREWRSAVLRPLLLIFSVGLISGCRSSAGKDARRLGIDTANTTHVLRYTFQTLARGEASDALIRSVAGHRSEAIQGVYTVAQNAEVIHLADRIERKLGLLKPNSGDVGRNLADSAKAPGRACRESGEPRAA